MIDEFDFGWMTVNEAAKRAGHSRQWVHHRIADGTFRAERMGRRWAVHTGSVAVWMLLELQRLVERLEHLNRNAPHLPPDEE